MPAVQTTKEDHAQANDGLHVAPQKTMARTHLYVGIGCHFGCTIYAFANIQKVIKNGLQFDAKAPNRARSLNELQEYSIYKQLLSACEGLKEALLKEDSTVEDIVFCANMFQKGANTVRRDNTKRMKGPIIEWITPHGQILEPPLNHCQKINRGFFHEVTGRHLCPAHLDWEDELTWSRLRNGELIVPGHSWPIFLYKGSVFHSEDPWKGLLKGSILVMAYKHIFISPSSINATDMEAATKGGNAQIHGMKKVTKASVVYTATQAHFALSSASFWSHTDRMMDLENFYSSLLGVLNNPANLIYVVELLVWWDRRIFPHARPNAAIVPISGSPLDQIRQLQIEQALTEVELPVGE
ncbi:hypothetical protein DXG01_001936 [Tephrocybe rancida]|nr:hypothetical protein DXG01_001936 [Tephrocybe rancida]